jgi:hypothetical protein
MFQRVKKEFEKGTVGGSAYIDKLRLVVKLQKNTKIFKMLTRPTNGVTSRVALHATRLF